MYFAFISFLHTQIVVEVYSGVIQGPNYFTINNMTAGGLRRRRRGARHQHPRHWPNLPGIIWAQICKGHLGSLFTETKKRIHYVPMCDDIKHGILFPELFDTNVTRLKSTISQRWLHSCHRHSNDSVNSSLFFILRFKILLVCSSKHVILFSLLQ